MWWWLGGGGDGSVKSFLCQAQLRLCKDELCLDWGLTTNINKYSLKLRNIDRLGARPGQSRSLK